MDLVADHLHAGGDAAPPRRHDDAVAEGVDLLRPVLQSAEQAYRAAAGKAPDVVAAINREVAEEAFVDGAVGLGGLDLSDVVVDVVQVAPINLADAGVPGNEPSLPP